jgi:hypothetical protein
MKPFRVLLYEDMHQAEVQLLAEKPRLFSPLPCRRSTLLDLGD